ncbi:hypothetical protein BC835DRAFT_1354591 [Cytidiella melzeri]|nr:hypothetical protein BC835DRAFT_1354591 [Cytidiella melzeri]
MRFLTFLILFVAIVTATFHSLAVSAAPVSSPPTPSSLGRQSTGDFSSPHVSDLNRRSIFNWLKRLRPSRKSKTVPPPQISGSRTMSHSSMIRISQLSPAQRAEAEKEVQRWRDSRGSSQLSLNGQAMAEWEGVRDHV